MSRIAFVCGMLILGAALAVGQPGPKVPPVPVAAPVQAENPVLIALRTVLREVPEVPVNPQTNLGNVLDALSERLQKDYKIQLGFSINYEAFNNIGLKEPAEIALVADKVLPRMVNVTLERYLRVLLARAGEKGPIPDGFPATFLVRKEHLEITTFNGLRKQIWGDHPGPFLALANATFEKKPLEEALRELAEQTEHNIILDARVADKSKALVSARFANTPLDTAVAMLADMAELQPILQDNAIYVTTRENALRWETRQKKGMPDDQDPARIGRVGVGVRGFVVPEPNAGAGME